MWCKQKRTEELGGIATVVRITEDEIFGDLGIFTSVTSKDANTASN